MKNQKMYFYHIIEKLNNENVTTKTGNIITHKDLRQAVEVMLKKHYKCRWRSEKVKNKKYLILIEGYYWIKYVYFLKEKSMYDADIKFFKDRIKQYEEITKCIRKEKSREQYCCKCFRMYIKKINTRVN